MSPTEVVQAHLNRIDVLEPTLRAFQVVRHAEALAEAEALSGRDDLGSLPLAGVPVAVKDNVDVAGTATDEDRRRPQPLPSNMTTNWWSGCGRQAAW